MNPRENEPRPESRRTLVTLVVSVVVGIVVGQLFEFDGHHLRIASFTGQGIAVDLSLTCLIILIVLAVLGLAVDVRPAHLVAAGTSLLVAAITLPALSFRNPAAVTVGAQGRSPFLLSAILEFIGAYSIGSGLRRIINDRRRKRAVAQRQKRKD